MPFLRSTIPVLLSMEEPFIPAILRMNGGVFTVWKWSGARNRTIEASCDAIYSNREYPWAPRFHITSSGDSRIQSREKRKEKKRPHSCIHSLFSSTTTPIAGSPKGLSFFLSPPLLVLRTPPLGPVAGCSLDL